MLRIITDFDGPIMDVSERYYRVYQFCLQQTRRQDQSVTVLSKDKFWSLKRSQIPEQQIGLLSGLEEQQTLEFSQLRRKTVHTQPYFEYDQLATDAVTVLEKMQKIGIDLAVMTMRRVSELNYALNKYDLGKFFSENRRYCLSNDYIKTGDTKDKPLLMQRALAELPLAAETWMIGDTEADIIAAKTHGVKVIGVLCGIRDRTQLELHKPEIIVNNLSEAVELILSKS